MRARFLLGPAGSGKTFHCLEEIRAALREKPEGPPLILLAPKQATFQLERQLLAGGEISGYARLHVSSFDRLARFILENLHVAPPPLLSDEGRVMILRALLRRHEEELKLFRRSARRSGFAMELSAQLNEFQQHQLTPARLRALSRRGGLPADLGNKLNDLALVQENYSRWLAEHGLHDANSLLDFATDSLKKEEQAVRSAKADTADHSSPLPLRISHLWMDGFAEMTPQERELLAATLPHCERATLAFCLESEPAGETSWISIWSAVGKSFQHCRQRIENLPGCNVELEILPRNSQKGRFAGHPEFAQMEKLWEQPPRDESAIRNPQSAISIHACASAEAEAAFAAREILKFVRAPNRHNRFRDCAVLVRDLQLFHRPVARIFRRYEIPFFLDRRESVAHHPLAELTRSALRTVAFNWQHNDWFAALKAGFSDAGQTEIDRLENESLARGWRGKKWHEPLPDDLLERLRRRILPPFDKLAAQLAHAKNSPTGEQLAVALRGLWDTLRAQETLEHWIRDGEDSAIGNRQSAMHPAVFEQMNVWLDNLSLAFPQEPLPLADWLPIVEAGLAGLTVGIIPPVLDEVLVGAIDRARNPDLKFALVLGMNEGIFPAAPAAATILTDADRDELGQSGLVLGPDLRERLARERYYGYIACTRASEKLALTFSHHDAGGKTLNPSPFIGHLRQIFPELEMGAFPANPDWREAEHASELAEPLATMSRSRRESAHPSPIEEQSRLTSAATNNWNALLKIAALKSLIDKLADLREPHVDQKLSPALAEKLYGPALQTSVSRLEEFAQCPFRFFVHSGLRAEERKMFELDARERGSFQHEVLKNFHEQLTAETRRWRDLTPAAARERVGQIAARLVEHFRDGLMRDTARTLFEARALAESLQDFIAVIVSWMRGQYEFDPAAAELAFGGENSGAHAWEVDLGGNRGLALRGRIDRIDLCRDGDRTLAVVMDYKSGGKKLDALLIEHGVQLQLLAYLNVVRHWENPGITPGVARLVPAGVFYVNLRGRYEGGETRDEVLGAVDARNLAYRHNGRFDIGALPKLDRAGAADQFNYRLNQDGTLRKGSVEALPRAEFEKLLDGVEMRLKEMGRAIFSGAATVDPYRKGAEIPCDFCDYRAACRIDPWTHQWRVLRAAKKNPA